MKTMSKVALLGKKKKKKQMNLLKKMLCLHFDKIIMSVQI